MPGEPDEIGCREWFFRLVNARQNPEVLAEAREWLLGLLTNKDMDSAPKTVCALSSLQTNPGIAFSPSLAEERAGASGNNSYETRESNGSNTPGPEALSFHAPVALLEGAWLQSVATAANGGREETAELFAAYLALLGEDEAASPAFAYRGLLQRAGVALPKVAAWRFAHDPSIGAPALHIASVHLALGWHSASFFAEALGTTLAYLRSVSPWRLPGLSDQRRRETLDAMEAHAQAALRSFLAHHGEWERVRHGYALYSYAEADYLAELENFARRIVSPADRVEGIFRRKLRFARGYHVGIKLGGRGLEDWFADTPFDAAGFLAAFAASDFAKGGRGRRPFDRLTAFGGPMFGVFDQEELAMIDAWLDGEKVGDEPPRDDFNPASSDSSPHPQTLSRRERGEKTCLGWAKRSVPIAPAIIPKETPLRNAANFFPFPPGSHNRTLFHRLINNEAGSQHLADARCRVENVLSRPRSSVTRKGFLGDPNFVYSPQAFAQRIARFHDEEVAMHARFQPPPRLRREEYVWGIRQFAPAILVDGCWLQHLGEAANQDSRIHRLLYRIYAEELGEGRVGWNHPRIYRDLLEELGVTLPSVENLEFARHPSLLDSAFDLPSYLLAVSQFPRDYLPEILGINLAIELSGLGTGYMRLAEELSYWKINPLIVTLHLSIDNLAGGHAAMAAEAIESYLDEIRLMNGDVAMQETWRRILRGYLSLESATWKFKCSLILAFCRRFLPGRLFCGLSWKIR